MEGSRGECCLIRYAGGAHDMAKVDRIMLKFRPIAPKPASDGSLSGGVSTPENSEPSRKATGRKKRRQTKDVSNVNNSGRTKRRFIRKRKTSPEETASGVKTLSFLPETPDDVKELPKKRSNPYPLWVSFAGGTHATPGVGHVPEDTRAAAMRRRVVVVLESVTDAWAADLNVLGRTDEEKLLNLDRDTCPGFVTDGLNIVRWSNGAYRKMVSGDVREVVVAEGVVPPVRAAAFTCVVRVVTCVKEKSTNFATLFCDVWRLECGGFAWRMDTKAALSLGRELN